jgi:hypothetical protein
MQIDWTRMAKPQADGYDGEVIRSLELPRRPQTRGAFRDGIIEAIVDVNGYSDYQVALCRESLADPRWAVQMTDFLSSWKAGYGFLVSYLDQCRAFSSGNPGRGCHSGHDEVSKDGPIHHNVIVSIDDLMLNGTAEGIYHEVGHLRLESLGVWIEHHDGRLIRNAPDELYSSPVRRDKKRPMSAVLHATYSWLMFTENDWQNYSAGAMDVDLFRDYSAHNLPKLRNGIAEVMRYAKPTRDGEAFLDGMRAWADDLLVRCDAVDAEKLAANSR